VEDNRKGLKNRAPMSTSQRVVMLGPGNESYDGPQYAYSPPTSGEVPRDNLGFFPQGTEEVPDKAFRSWPEEE
jgi:hypothetical protein